MVEAILVVCPEAIISKSQNEVDLSVIEPAYYQATMFGRDSDRSLPNRESETQIPKHTQNYFPNLLRRHVLSQIEKKTPREDCEGLTLNELCI